MTETVIDNKKEQLNAIITSLINEEKQINQKSKQEAFAEKVKQTVSTMIKAGTAPWLVPHAGKESIPYNPVTGYEYSGFNALWLKIAQSGLHSKDARWMTFTDAQKNNLRIKSGEKATQICYSQKDMNGNWQNKFISVFNGTQIKDIPEQENNIPAHKEFKTDTYRPNSLHPKETVRADLVNYMSSIYEGKPFEPKGLNRAEAVATFLDNSKSGTFFFIVKDAATTYRTMVSKEKNCRQVKQKEQVNEERGI